MYLADGTDPPVFRHVAAPGAKDLQDLVERIAARMGRLLEKRGIIERDSKSAWLSGEMTGPLDDLLGHSITYRIAMGPRAGQKLFTLQTVPAEDEFIGAHSSYPRADNQHESISTCYVLDNAPLATEWIENHDEAFA